LIENGRREVDGSRQITVEVEWWETVVVLQSPGDVAGYLLWLRFEFEETEACNA